MIDYMEKMNCDRCDNELLVQKAAVYVTYSHPDMSCVKYFLCEKCNSGVMSFITHVDSYVSADDGIE